jgi:hypothetical protein
LRRYDVGKASRKDKPMLRRPSSAQVLRSLRFVHAWLGIIVVPWIIIIGATGLYLNHSRAIFALIDVAPYDEASFADWPGAAPVSEAQALVVARGVWPDEPVKSTKNGKYHKMPAYIFQKQSGRIIVTQATGHYFVKTWRTRTTFAPDGQQLHRRIYWGSIFKQLHTDGWSGGGLGTWLADITSVAMVVFGLSGIFLWWMPRARRIARLFGRGRGAKVAPVSASLAK